MLVGSWGRGLVRSMTLLALKVEVRRFGRGPLVKLGKARKWDGGTGS